LTPEESVAADEYMRSHDINTFSTNKEMTDAQNWYLIRKMNSSDVQSLIKTLPHDHEGRQSNIHIMAEKRQSDLQKQAKSSS
jgi:hypothetical protein